jgi:hypothetical protein
MTTSTITNSTTTSTFQILYLLTLLLLLLELNTFIYSPPPLLQLLYAPCQAVIQY